MQLLPTEQYSGKQDNSMTQKNMPWNMHRIRHVSGFQKKVTKDNSLWQGWDFTAQCEADNFMVLLKNQFKANTLCWHIAKQKWHDTRERTASIRIIFIMCLISTWCLLYLMSAAICISLAFSSLLVLKHTLLLMYSCCCVSLFFSLCVSVCEGTLWGWRERRLWLMHWKTTEASSHWSKCWLQLSMTEVN